MIPDFLTVGRLKNVGDLILSCTKKDPSERPSAKHITRSGLFSDSNVADVQAAVIKSLEEENIRLRKLVKQQSEEIRKLQADRTLSKTLSSDIVDLGNQSDDDY